MVKYVCQYTLWRQLGFLNEIKKIEWSGEMVEKTCDKCQKPSYSSNYQGEWICPYCGKDLTEIQVNNEDYLYKAVVEKK